jgi:GH18 family chitinase
MPNFALFLKRKMMREGLVKLFKSLLLTVMIISLTLLISCRDDDVEIEDGYLDEPVCTEAFIPKTYDHQVVGFYPSYRLSSLPVSEIKWDKITRVVYAFAKPQPDGTLNTSELTAINQLVEEGHAHGVEVYFSVGGGGTDSENFPIVASSAEARETMVKEIRQYLFEHCLDGVDIDWEHWTGSATNTVNMTESGALLEIVKNLKNEIEPFGLGISIDVYASDWGGKHILDEVEDHVDHVQIMAYDFSGPWSDPGPHSSYEQAIGSGADVGSTGLAYWVNYRGFSKDKIFLGVPFYGRDFDNQGGAGITYSNILDMYPDAWQFDQVDNIYYNGLATMERKAQYVKEQDYPGVMIWELAQDHYDADSLSLLHTLDQVLNP